MWNEKGFASLRSVFFVSPRPKHRGAYQTAGGTDKDAPTGNSETIGGAKEGGGGKAGNRGAEGRAKKAQA